MSDLNEVMVTLGRIEERIESNGREAVNLTKELRAHTVQDNMNFSEISREIGQLQGAREEARATGGKRGAQWGAGAGGAIIVLIEVIRNFLPGGSTPTP